MKDLQKCGSKEHYVLAKKVAKRRLFVAKKKAEKEKMKDIETDTNNTYRTVKQMKQENKDCWQKMYLV